MTTCSILGMTSSAIPRMLLVSIGSPYGWKPQSLHSLQLYENSSQLVSRSHLCSIPKQNCKLGSILRSMRGSGTAQEITCKPFNLFLKLLVLSSLKIIPATPDLHWLINLTANSLPESLFLAAFMIFLKTFPNIIHNEWDEGYSDIHNSCLQSSLGEHEWLQEQANISNYYPLLVR